MSHQHCAVPHCRKSGYRIENGKKVTFHRFPRDTELKKQWLIKIKRDESESFQVKQHTTVCSLHFKDGDFEVHGYSGRRTLLPGTVPSIFDCWKNVLHAYKTPKERQPNRLKEQRERQAHLRKFESPQARSQRLKAQRERQALLRQTESPQAKSQRLKEQREHQARLRQLKKQREIQADLRQSNSVHVDFIISHPDTTGMISLRNSVHQFCCLGDKSEKCTADIMDPHLSNSTCDFNEIGIKEEMFEHHTHEIQPTVNQHVNIKQEVDTKQAITGVDMNRYLSMMKIPLIKRELPWNTHESRTEEHGHTELVEEHKHALVANDFKQTYLHVPEVKTEGMSPMRTGDSSHVISNNTSHIKTEVISDNEHEMSAYANTEIIS